jgi:hypothetical protein
MEYAVVLILIAGILLSTFNLFGWSKNMFYPFPNHKRKAVILWLYGLPIAILLVVLVYLKGFGWWTQATLYFLTFIHLTTLTFGILPYYGGAYREYWEIQERKRAAPENERNGRVHHDTNDSTLISFDEVCNDCLSAVLSSDKKCWRCGKTIRWKTRFTERWTKDSKSLWTKTKESGQTLWQREWHPDYYYVDERGVTTNFGVGVVFAIVKEDGRWSLHAMPRTPADEDPHVVPLKEGREHNPRAARKRVNSVILDVDFKKVVDEN